MSVRETVEELRRGFAFDDQISLTDLRRGSDWINDLESRGKLRVSSYQEAIGVVVSSRVWRGLEGLARFAEQFQALLDEFEDEDIERLWGDRADQERRPADEVASRAMELLRRREG